MSPEELLSRTDDSQLAEMQVSDDEFRLAAAEAGWRSEVVNLLLQPYEGWVRFANGSKIRNDVTFSGPVAMGQGHKRKMYSIRY